MGFLFAESKCDGTVWLHLSGLLWSGWYCGLHDMCWGYSLYTMQQHKYISVWRYVSHYMNWGTLWIGVARLLPGRFRRLGSNFNSNFNFMKVKIERYWRKKSLLVSLCGYMVHYTHWLLRIILLNPVFSSRYSVRSKIWFGQKKKTYDFTADDFMSHWLFQIL